MTACRVVGVTVVGAVCPGVVAVMYVADLCVSLGAVVAAWTVVLTAVFADAVAIVGASSWPAVHVNPSHA